MFLHQNQNAIDRKPKEEPGKESPLPNNNAMDRAYNKFIQQSRDSSNDIRKSSDKELKMNEIINLANQRESNEDEVRVKLDHNSSLQSENGQDDTNNNMLRVGFTPKIDDVDMLSPNCHMRIEKHNSFQSTKLSMSLNSRNYNACLKPNLSKKKINSVGFLSTITKKMIKKNQDDDEESRIEDFLDPKMKPYSEGSNYPKEEKKFNVMSQVDQNAHVVKLWTTCLNKAKSGVTVINGFKYLRGKHNTSNHLSKYLCRASIHIWRQQEHSL